MSSIDVLESLAEAFKTEDYKMPVVFVGHGSPTNAIENNSFTQNWLNFGKSIPKPKAIVSVSAHWLTEKTLVTAMDKPRTIYDFYGFPKEMYELKYPAPGSPVLSDTVIVQVKEPKIGKDFSWGLDHGTWAVLIKMFPEADIPVIQLSIAANEPPDFHYELGKKLNFLRNKGILLLCSGNIVHNLRLINWEGGAYDWAKEFDNKVKNLLDERNFTALINYDKLDREAALSIPTNDHYLPMLYALGAYEKNEEISYFNDEITMGSLSMRCIKIS